MMVFIGTIVITGHMQRLALKAPMSAIAAEEDAGSVTGFAWSDNVGWISFSSKNEPSGTPAYGVTVDTSTFATKGVGAFSGYAWSEHIGWVSFNSDAGTPPGAPSHMARVDWGTGKITGWARALVAKDGWDGWILFSDDANTNWAGKGATITLSGAGAGKITGWAWGSDVVGWIDLAAGNATAGGGGVVVVIPPGGDACTPLGKISDGTGGCKCPTGSLDNGIGGCMEAGSDTTCSDGTLKSTYPGGICPTVPTDTGLCPDDSLKSTHIGGVCTNGIPGDGECDTGETTFNSPRDCKPAWYQF